MPHRPSWYIGPLTVPGDFLPQSAAQPVQEHLRLLQEKVDNLKPIPTSAHGAGNHRTRVPTALLSAKFVFLRREARKPLETPYVGPYEVIAKHEKYYTLQMGNRQEKVSIDHLKAAVVDQKLPVQVAQPPNLADPQ